MEFIHKQRRKASKVINGKSTQHNTHTNNQTNKQNKQTAINIAAHTVTYDNDRTNWIPSQTGNDQTPLGQFARANGKQFHEPDRWTNAILIEQTVKYCHRTRAT
jgi:hypothetical protein